MWRLLPVLLGCACRGPTPAAPPFTFVVLGDRTDEPDDAAWRATVAAAAARRPDLILHVGDLADDCFDPSDWATAMAPLAGLPVAYTPGNHDVIDEASARIFEERTGQAPYRSFEAGGVHFVIVDNAVADSWEQLPEAQRTWLAADLEAHGDEPVVVAMHKPFWALGRALGRPDPLHDLFVRTGVDVVFTGHWHNHLYEALDGVRYVGVGTSGGAWRGVVQDARLGNAYELVSAVRTADGFDLAAEVDGQTVPIDLVTRADNARLREAWLGGVSARFEDGAITVRAKASDGVVTTSTRPTPDGWAPGALPLPRAEVDLALPSGRVVPWTVVVDAPGEVLAPRGRAIVDGVLDEWASTPGTRAATNVEGTASRAEPTTFWLRHDDDALYFAFRAADGQPDALHVAHPATERDGNVVFDDRVGMVLTAGPDAWVWFYVTPAGAIWDLRRAEGAVDRAWDGVEARATVDATGWSVEGRIPWSAMPADAAATWGVDVRRRQERLQAEATFTPAFSSRDPERIGRLRLE